MALSNAVGHPISPFEPRIQVLIFSWKYYLTFGMGWGLGYFFFLKYQSSKDYINDNLEHLRRPVSI